MTMRGGMKTPYKVFTTPIAELQPMADFRPFFDAMVTAKGA